MTARQKRAAVLGALLLGVAVLVLVLMRGGTALVVSKPVPDPDAIVSLASHEWERLPEAAHLAARFPRAELLLTQPKEVTIYNCHDCSNRVHRLERAGVAKERVRIVPLQEGGTYGEALAVRRLVATSGLKRVLVVTSPYHTRRSFSTFVDVLAPVGVQVGVAPATTSSRAAPAWWWWLPDDRAYVPYEWAAIAYYAVFHGVPPY